MNKQEFLDLIGKALPDDPMVKHFEIKFYVEPEQLKEVMRTASLVMQDAAIKWSCDAGVSIEFKPLMLTIRAEG